LRNYAHTVWCNRPCGALFMTASPKSKIIHALIAERGSLELATEYTAGFPAENELREIVECWVKGSARYLVAIDLSERILVGMPDDLADVWAIIGIAHKESRGAPLNLRIMCSEATGVALLEAPGLVTLRWTEPPVLH
jgi:hypothetical protein